jgi:hypothetical protein
MSERCADLSRAAAEPLGATASTASRWLLVEMPGSWPRDVADGAALPLQAREVVTSWLRAAGGARLQFIRRPGRESERPLCFVVRSEEHVAQVRRIELASHADLAETDLDAAGEVAEGSLLLVCGHGSRDQCCALRGTAVFGALAERLGEEEVWVSSHQGGHRFAPNLLVLPSGLQFGRVEPGDSLYLAARALAGRIDLQHYRGRTCYGGPVQAAELAVRRQAGLEGVAEIRLEAVEDAVITFRGWDGDEYTVVVDEVAGPSVPASCGMAPEPQRLFRASSVTHNPGVSRAVDTRDR